MTTRNKRNLREIRVIAQRRSGHHGVIKWLLSHFPGESYHYNNVARVEAFSAEAISAGDPEMVRDETFFNANSGPARDCYLFNVEGEELPEIMNGIADNRWMTQNGTSHRVDHLFVIRDPYNQLASAAKLFGENAMWDMLAQWRNYAREFIGPARCLPQDTVRVSFNAWFGCKEYRRTISDRLFLKFNDSGIHTPYGWPSVFEPDVKDAQTRGVLDRWRNFLGTEPYSTLIRDPEMNELAEEIFGEFAVRIRKAVESASTAPAEAISEAPAEAISEAISEAPVS